MITDVPRDIGAYRFVTAIQLRYSDTDKLGHINNTVFCTLLESGRAALLFERGEPIAGAGKTFFIANLNLDFIAEMNYPGTAHIGTAVGKFGNSSLLLHQAIFHNGACCAVSHSTIVLVDESTRRPTAMPEELKATIRRLAGGA